MKVDILIERDKAGRLHAYVTQLGVDGNIQKGDDLLKKRVIRNVDDATVECERAIRQMFILLDLEGIDYTFPADWTE